MLREPLVHFFVLGAAIFAAFAIMGRHTEEAPTRIVVSAGHIEHLASGFTRTWQRPPTSDELAGLIDDYVRDEVYYREGMALGLERDDSVVRRRLRQKMEFLVEDATASPPPSDDELQTFLTDHPDRYRLEPEVSFHQVYFDRDRDGAGAAAEAHALVARLAGAGPDADVANAGDRIMLPSEVARAPASEVARLFGDAFVSALAAIETGRWAGPLESSYGLHVVFLRARSAGRLPTLAEVRDAVTRDAAGAERTRMRDAAYARLRERYEIVIERPRGDAVVTP